MRKHTIPPVLALTASALALVPLCGAQQENNAGLGTVKRSWDVTEQTNAMTRATLLVGTAFLNGNFYVSGADNNGMRSIWEYDASGNLLRTFAAPPSASADTAGIRDMATDGSILIGASKLGVIPFDLNGNEVTTIQAANGPQTVTVPITGTWVMTLNNQVRAVAYDPAGNGGNGCLWVGNNPTGLPILQVDLQGNVINSFPDQGWEAYGLALDPVTGNLWVNSLVGANPNAGPIAELDINNMLAPTGVTFPQMMDSFHGGLDGIVGGDPGSYPSHFDLVAMNQAFPDTAAVHRVHLYPNLQGKDEAFLEGGINAAPFAAGDLGTVNAGDTLGFRVNPGSNPLNNGTLAWIVFNFGNDAVVDGVTNIPIPGVPNPFPELRALGQLSSPISLGAPIVGTVAGNTTSITMPAGLFAGFDMIRMQALYLDLGLASAGNPFPFVATSEIFTNFFDEPTAHIVVEANGADSFVNNVPTGYWKVRYLAGGPSITRVTFDYDGSSNKCHKSDSVFDIDNPNMGDFFDAGNSTIAGCAGTYRNGSDALTGLVYDGLNHPVRGCNTQANANSGFIAEHVVSPAASYYKRLTFRFNDFTQGETFEFDCDTDNVCTNGGAGGPNPGDQQAGLLIIIELSDGRELRGELRVDPNTAGRSVAGFRL